MSSRNAAIHVENLMSQSDMVAIIISSKDVENRMINCIRYSRRNLLIGLSHTNVAFQKSRMCSVSFPV